eukprot:CAMPEP_0172500218 /NCGR_PEP_ID=MMETSP1066-20121228/135851_1 /TAXON_ID=671091 /ORGANISM="Coscinodiscus wailesii, Strain CCMP2513" /LENGTH=703 /DNA_ID=CAMNT_0013274341 /DNA_START=306 /DNA_END=2417 /DNA_ORIENTATION=-
MAFEVPTKAQIDSRIECSEESENATLGGAKVRFAYLSQRGYYPDDPNKANQDAFSVTHRFASVQNDAFLAVYDGHGKHGDKCAQFCKHRLPEMVAKQIAQNKIKNDNSETSLHQACKHAHINCNLTLHKNSLIDDQLSGTTSISAYFHGPGNSITVCNVGDSRAIMGSHRKSNDGGGGGDDPAGPSPLRAHPLSRDQTPYRKDERQRVKKTGARVLSLDQIEGLEPETEADWNNETEIDLGEEIDEWGDPPRVWSPHGEYPGTAFTRSLGDSIAEELGVYAEPEIMTRELTEDDKIIVLASDGVFEFLTNQSVIDICAKFQDPLEACRAVVAEAYELWLQYELRTDDITIICIFVDGLVEGRAGVERLPSQQRGSIDSFTNGDMPEINDGLPIMDSRPVRTLPSKESLVTKKARKNAAPLLESVEDENFDISTLITEKTEGEKELIANAIKASVMFRNLSPEQKELIYGCMEPLKVKAGDWVIKQGSTGEKYYIIDNGTFEVRIVPEDQTAEQRKDGGDVVHMYVGSRKDHAHPSFGELALMHSAPRAASIIAVTDGQLWALHRSAFRQVLKTRTERKGVMRALRKIDSLKCLTLDEVEMLANCAEEVNFADGETIITQGDFDNCFYFIVNGMCACERTQDDKVDTKELGANNYFGGKSLFGEVPHSFTAKAKTATKCIQLSKIQIEGNIPDFLERQEKFGQR